MVRRKYGLVFFNLLLFALFGLFCLSLIFEDEIRGWSAEDRKDLTPSMSIVTPKSAWDLQLCIAEVRIVGLGMQNRRGPREFVWIDPHGIERRVDSYTNAARDTRLDVVDFNEHRLVEFFSNQDRAMREGERAHLAECLDVKELPAN